LLDEGSIVERCLACEADTVGTGEADFGGARFPNCSMILTKVLAAPKSERFVYTNTLAEPRFSVSQVEAGVRRPMHLKNQVTCHTEDPRLGTRIGLARPWDSPTSVASLKVSGRAGASPYQIAFPGSYRFGLASEALHKSLLSSELQLVSNA